MNPTNPLVYLTAPWTLNHMMPPAYEMLCNMVADLVLEGYMVFAPHMYYSQMYNRRLLVPGTLEVAASEECIFSKADELWIITAEGWENHARTLKAIEAAEKRGMPIATISTRSITPQYMCYINGKRWMDWKEVNETSVKGVVTTTIDEGFVWPPDVGPKQVDIKWPDGTVTTGHDVIWHKVSTQITEKVPVGGGDAESVSEIEMQEGEGQETADEPADAPTETKTVKRNVQCRAPKLEISHFGMVNERRIGRMKDCMIKPSAPAKTA